MAAPSIPRSSRLALVAVASLLLAAGCTPAAQSAAPTAAVRATSALVTAAPPSATPAPTFPVTLTDDEGTDVTVPSEPQRIVSLTPATTEILFAIDAGPRVVGKVEDIAKYPPEAESIPIVATFSGVDVEKVVALEPDLVISGGAGLTQGDAVEQLRRAGIPVLVAYPTTIDGALAGIRTIGTAVGEHDAAATLADEMARDLDDLATIASTAPDRPRLFYEIDVTGGIFTPPAESIYGEMFKLAGSEPIPGDASYSISLEALVAADPEVILLGDAAYGVTPEAVAARPGWGDMTAVKNERIEPIDDIVVTRPGPRLVQGLEALIRAIHPDLASQLPSLLPSQAPSPATTLAALPTAA
jgi:iron complex transport system substrate-binding protein